MAALRVPQPRSVAAQWLAVLLPGQLARDETVVGLVWATVDLERTVDEAEAPFLLVDRDRILGGRVARLRYGALDLLVEEPDTEARLAANLSRFGEGLAAWYVQGAGSRGTAGPAGGPSRPLPTPLDRPGFLRSPEFPWGPFIIVVGPR